ncbi:Anaphase-promoting complex subunit 2 [Fulvia fulva]|uniref:Anaphase-promoting complex subunit 2 n=1 Tax=Passalora fulva TaxID=5499 RepID=A0A9Q8PK36_PASFU|nr:Anaphase-promoting complex subunit 2 [Fulvia fulva]KAK4611533.1 Anaphase-promoting complex subunit 2 [Fulvia fulva]KAK4612610.1 Anaphase-promoting complex subunit 2 [Fulvia fulva]UJO23872.1 Anaphase-promoting complex subunit 2 [Fulvia fulva]WPV20854.1 Anaphase-promoting complex subunit 2 [Fulvia fulva]WPV36387.1 Anaphase-promoting complex subunit 2 [Fulvia fulva]
MAAAVQQTPRSQRHDIFASVFPPKNHTTPTPVATPNIGTLASPGATFGGFNTSSNPADGAVKLSQAWSTTTRYLALKTSASHPAKSLEQARDVRDALHYLLGSRDTRAQLHDWYLHEVGAHFRGLVAAELSFWQQPITLQEARQVLSNTVQIIQRAQDLCLRPLDDTLHAANDVLLAFAAEIKQGIHVLVLHCLPHQRLQKTLASYLFQTMKRSLQQGSNPERCTKAGRCYCQLGLDLSALHELHDVGLGGTVGQRAFAHAVHRILEGPAVERPCFQVSWTGKDTVIPSLRLWINEQFVPAVQRAVATLSGDPSTRLPHQQFVSAAVSSFGRRRVEGLFNYVSMWPDSRGGVLDVREYLISTNSSDKAHLCSSFTEQIQRRLLHAGASTTEILSIYVSVINVFKLLDSRGVLLEKVAIPIRNYLRGREDTVTVIAASFLAEIDKDGEIHGQEPDKVCPDITLAIASSAVDAEDDRLLNWDDMNWVPDPIDAGPNYKASKSDDIVAYVLGLFDPDDFIKALAGVFGDHLLHTHNTDLIKETRLVELLKSRLDATKLQQAEVMLKDMRDSNHLNRRVNPRRGRTGTKYDLQAALPEDGITMISLWEIFEGRMDKAEFMPNLRAVGKERNGLWFANRRKLPADDEPPSSAGSHDIDFNAKVISSYFWPAAHELEFRVPTGVKTMMKTYEESFASISGQRTLAWKRALGTTDIALYFDDGRVIEEKGLEEWKASIIDAFALDRQGEADAPPVDYNDKEGLTIDELMDGLNLEEGYLVSGIQFWIGKQALYEKSKGRWAVLEHLDMAHSLIHEPPEPAEDPAVNLELAALKENAATYQNFIEGMLRNQGGKQIEGVMGITFMLGMVMTDFAYGDDEVRWLLEEMEARGVVTKNGELWTVV